MNVRMILRRVVGADRERAASSRRIAHFALFIAIAAMIIGCGQTPLPATVEGTLRLNGKPLDNFLVIFFPEPEKDQPDKPRSVGITDAEGKFRLRCDDQRSGASTGWHRVTIRDLSASTGVRRRDHGTVDADDAPASPPPRARPSRVSPRYGSPTDTPLRKEIKPGDQIIDLEIR